jgi:hypothetical protein
LRRLAALASVGALAFAVSACGGSGAGANTGNPSAAPTSAAAITGVRSLDFTEQQFHLHFLGPLTYAQKPPFGGAHSPIPLNCGVYTQPVPNENAVHSLEHGAVWLTYRNGVDPAPLAALTSIDQSYTLVSPFPGQASPVVASTWGLQLAVNSPTDPRLGQFVETYVRNDRGGEQGARCAGASPEQAQELLDHPPQANSQPPPVPADRAG